MTTEPVRVAIVGAEEGAWPLGEDTISLIKQRILAILRKYRSVELVSGECPNRGIDIWAEQIADSLGIPKMIFKPEVLQWSNRDGKRGYKSRNKQIAIYCSELYDFEPVGHWSGGTWTAEFARKLGKYAEVVEIEF